MVDVVGESSPPGIKNKVYGKAEYDKAQVVSNFFRGEGAGGRIWAGGPNLPTPTVFSLAFSHTPFLLRDIKALLTNFPLFLPLPALSELPPTALFLYLIRYPSAPFLPGLSSYTY